MSQPSTPPDSDSPAQPALPIPDPPRGRRLFLGDVHGCREELEALLERVAFDSSRDRLLPVGDLVNRGPDSLGALRLLRSLGAETVLGNHDLHFLKRVRTGQPAKPLDTLEELLGAEDLEDLAGWLSSQPLLRDHGDLFQVHAGLSPAWSDPGVTLGANSANLESVRPEDRSFAVSARRCLASGQLVRSPEHTGAAAWDSFYDPDRFEGRRVVFGHWAERGLVRHAGACGLDTGCVWGGALTIWIAEEDRFVSEPARRTYCAVRSNA